MKVLVFAAAAAFCLAPPAMAKGPEHGTLTVTATEPFSQENTLASISFGIETRADTAAAAAARNSEMMARVFAIVDAARIDRKDVSTSGLRLDPMMEAVTRRQGAEDVTEERVRGYRMGNLVTITIRDLAVMDKVLGDVIAAGVNRIDHIGFRAEPDDALRLEARLEAVRRARAEAEKIAEAAGGRIVGIESVTTGGGPFLPMSMDMMRMESMVASAAPVPVSGGSSESSETATITYQVILDRKGSEPPVLEAGDDAL